MEMLDTFFFKIFLTHNQTQGNHISFLKQLVVGTCTAEL